MRAATSRTLQTTMLDLRVRRRSYSHTHGKWYGNMYTMFWFTAGKPYGCCKVREIDHSRQDEANRILLDRLRNVIHVVWHIYLTTAMFLLPWAPTIPVLGHATALQRCNEELLSASVTLVLQIDTYKYTASLWQYHPKEGDCTHFCQNYEGPIYYMARLVLQSLQIHHLEDPPAQRVGFGWFIAFCWNWKYYELIRKQPSCHTNVITMYLSIWN